MTRQHLIVDADDTLWENNIYFEQAFDEFYEYLGHSHLSADEVRATISQGTPPMLISVASEKPSP